MKDSGRLSFSQSDLQILSKEVPLKPLSMVSGKPLKPLSMVSANLTTNVVQVPPPVLAGSFVVLGWRGYRGRASWSNMVDR